MSYDDNGIIFRDKYSNINAVNFIPEKNNVSTSKLTQENMDATSRSGCLFYSEQMLLSTKFFFLFLLTMDDFDFFNLL